MANVVKSPLRHIYARRFRKTRAEQNIETLVRGSFPHAIIGNLGMLVVEADGQNDRSELGQRARELRECEEALGYLDFFRYVKLTRADNELTLTISRLVVDINTPSFVDTRETHEVAVTIKQTLDNGAPFATAGPLAKYLIDQHRRMRLPPPQLRKGPERWVVDTKTLNLRQGDGLNGLSTKKFQHITDVGDVRTALVDFFQRPEFTLQLTPTHIICRDIATRFQARDRPARN